MNTGDIFLEKLGKIKIRRVVKDRLAIKSNFWRFLGYIIIMHFELIAIGQCLIIVSKIYTPLNNNLQLKVKFI